MAGSRKKVIVRQRDGSARVGYLPASGLLDGDGALSLLDLEGRMAAIAPAEVRYVAYVRDFNLGDAADPERLTRRTFLARPRQEGVWVRLTMLGGDVLEGLVAADAGLADGLLEDGGLFLTPPDVRSNTQRLFVPRVAFSAMQVVAVITSPGKKVVEPSVERGQERLFT